MQTTEIAMHDKSHRTFLETALAFASFLTGIRWSVLILFSYTALRRRHRLTSETIDRWPLVSILVPAYNELDTIVPAVESLLKLDLTVCRLLARLHIRLPGLSCYLLCQRRG